MPGIVQAARFDKGWLDSEMQSQHVSIPGPPEIVPVQDFRGTNGITRPNMSAGSDPASKPRTASAYQRARDRSNAR